jgi:hypothetical protein
MSESTAQYINSWSANPVPKTGISALLYSGQKSSMNTCLDTTILGNSDVSLAS